MTDSARVLVIDNEALLRSLLQDMLAACGYDADVAESGAAGVCRFKEGGYGTVITDLLMPGMNGLEVVTALRTIDPQVNIILLTGSIRKQTIAHAQEMGVTLLHKPIALGDLKAAVDAARRT